MAIKLPTFNGARPAAAPARPAAKQATPDAPKKKVSPAQFLREVRAEMRKITWTSRRETWITTVMVFIMVALAAVFFLAVDYTLGFGMKALLENFAAS